jgi:hypothetical protein
MVSFPTPSILRIPVFPDTKREIGILHLKCVGKKAQDIPSP